MFVDEALKPFADQWAALSTTAPVPAIGLDALIARIEDGRGGLDILLGDPDGDARP